MPHVCVKIRKQKKAVGLQKRSISEVSKPFNASTNKKDCTISELKEPEEGCTVEAAQSYAENRDQDSSESGSIAAIFDVFFQYDVYNFEQVLKEMPLQVFQR